MRKQVTLLRVVVASPGDVKGERDLLPGVIEEVNRDTAHALDLHLDLRRWETDAHPGFHIAGPQGLIDPLLEIQTCDILIGIFWRRFGTISPDGTSGTVHELRVAFQSWQRTRLPQIMVYFKRKEYDYRTTEELEQRKQVLDFMNNFPKEGLWWPYAKTPEFEKLVAAHLRNHLRGVQEQRVVAVRDFHAVQEAASAGATGVQGRLHSQAVDALLEAVEFYEVRSNLGDSMTRQLIGYLITGNQAEADRLFSGCGFSDCKRQHISRVANEAFTYLDTLSSAITKPPVNRTKSPTRYRR